MSIYLVNQFLRKQDVKFGAFFVSTRYNIAAVYFLQSYVNPRWLPKYSSDCVSPTMYLQSTRNFTSSTNFTRVHVLFFFQNTNINLHSCHIEIQDGRNTESNSFKIQTLIIIKLIFLRKLNVSLKHCTRLKGFKFFGGHT